MESITAAGDDHHRPVGDAVEQVQSASGAYSTAPEVARHAADDQAEQKLDVTTTKAHIKRDAAAYSAGHHVPCRCCRSQQVPAEGRRKMSISCDGGAADRVGALDQVQRVVGGVDVLVSENAALAGGDGVDAPGS